MSYRKGTPKKVRNPEPGTTVLKRVGLEFETKLLANVDRRERILTLGEFDPSPNPEMAIIVLDGGRRVSVRLKDFCRLVPRGNGIPFMQPSTKRPEIAKGDPCYVADGYSPAWALPQSVHHEGRDQSH